MNRPRRTQPEGGNEPNRWSEPAARSLAALTLGANGGLAMQGLAVLWGNDPVLPGFCYPWLGAAALIAPLWTLGKHEPPVRVGAALSLLGFGTLLLSVGDAALAPPTTAIEVNSLFAAELGRTLAGFPLTAIIALFGSLGHAGVIARFVPKASWRLATGVVISGALVAPILSWATGGLGF